MSKKEVVGRWLLLSSTLIIGIWLIVSYFLVLNQNLVQTVDIFTNHLLVVDQNGHLKSLSDWSNVASTDQPDIVQLETNQSNGRLGIEIHLPNTFITQRLEIQSSLTLTQLALNQTGQSFLTADSNGQWKSISLTTDDIVEGSTNLYFTEARAKSMFISSNTVDYDVDTATFSWIGLPSSTLSISGSWPNYKPRLLLTHYLAPIQIQWPSTSDQKTIYLHFTSRHQPHVLIGNYWLPATPLFYVFHFNSTQGNWFLISHGQVEQELLAFESDWLVRVPITGQPNNQTDLLPTIATIPCVLFNQDISHLVYYQSNGQLVSSSSSSSAAAAALTFDTQYFLSDISNVYTSILWDGTDRLIVSTDLHIATSIVPSIQNIKLNATTTRTTTPLWSAWGPPTTAAPLYPTYTSGTFQYLALAKNRLALSASVVDQGIVSIFHRLSVDDSIWIPVQNIVSHDGGDRQFGRVAQWSADGLTLYIGSHTNSTPYTSWIEIWTRPTILNPGTSQFTMLTWEDTIDLNTSNAFYPLHALQLSEDEKRLIIWCNGHSIATWYLQSNNVWNYWDLFLDSILLLSVFIHPTGTKMWRLSTTGLLMSYEWKQRAWHLIPLNQIDTGHTFSPSTLQMNKDGSQGVIVSIASSDGSNPITWLE